MSHTKLAMKRTTIKTPRASVYHKLSFTAWKYALRLISKYSLSPQRYLILPLNTQHLPKHCCMQTQRLLSLKNKTIELLCSLQEQPLSYLYCWPKGLRDHLWERRLCNYVLMFPHIALTFTSAFYKSTEQIRQHNREKIYIFINTSNEHSQKT